MSSALPIANRRYSRLQICATSLDSMATDLSTLQCAQQNSTVRCMKCRARIDSYGRQRVVATLSLILEISLCLFLTGCASTKIDWNSRIGNYTYDQAVIELGPPDKYAKLTDGTVVAEWMTRRGYSGGSVGFMYGYGYPYHAYPYPLYPPYYLAEPPSPDYFIRLTFGPEGKLQAYKRVVR